jgi:catechol 2,3-dioxygenase-like lactoylglutathione lyase family enzyme
MSHRGFSHIGLSTLDLDKTREFYEGVLGFKSVVADTINVKEGGHLRHLFFDIGRDPRWEAAARFDGGEAP